MSKAKCMNWFKLHFFVLNFINVQSLVNEPFTRL